MSASSLNRFLPTLNVVLLFAGYQFFSGIVSIFTNNAQGSHLVNVGYRGFYAIVCLLVLLTNSGSKHPRANRIILILFFFWFLLLLRFTIDMYFRPDVSVLPAIRSRTLLYMVVLTLFPMVSVLLSIEKVDFDIALKWITILISVSIVIAFIKKFNYSSYEIEGMERTSTEGLSSIGTGQLGVTAVVLSIYYLIKGSKKLLLMKVAMVLVSFLGIVVLLRSGSRGPLLAIVGVGSMLGISKAKNPLIWIPLLLLFVLFYDQIFDFILNAISYIAPNLTHRFVYKAEIGRQFDNRLFHYTSAIEAFRQSPIFGKQFAIYLPDGEMIYAHNLFLDSIMQLGIIGGALMLTIIIGTLRLVYRLIRQGDSLMWLCLLFVQQLFYLMVSSSIYYTPLLSICIVLLFQCDSIRKKKQLLSDI